MTIDYWAPPQLSPAYQYQQQQQAVSGSNAPKPTMPAGQQQIYNYNSPSGSASTYNPNDPNSTYNPNSYNLNANYTGFQQANPYQPSYMAQPTQGQATTINAAQLGQGLNPALMQGLSPQAAEQSLYSAFMPAQATATRGLNDQLAAMGIQGGAAINADNNLQTQMGQGLGNSLSSLISGAQSNQLSAADTQAGLNQQAGISNQNAMNQMTSNNVANLFGANQYNATAANDAQAASTGQSQNAYTQNLANFMNMLSGQYNGSLGTIGAGMNSTQNLAGSMINQYPQYSSSSSDFGNLGSKLGSNTSTAGAADGGTAADALAFSVGQGMAAGA